MSNLLTSRQAEELHKSLIAYLSACGHTAAAQAVRDDVNLPESSFDPATTKKYEGLLEKKWTSVVRLQKKIMDLESRTTQRGCRGRPHGIPYNPTANPSRASPSTHFS
ncbi:hypothetical protein KC319_g6443, partial [Hortaea werneckii]